MDPADVTLDQDGDGKISADEQEQASGALLKLDTNSDGRIEMEKWRPTSSARWTWLGGGRHPGFGPQPGTVEEKLQRRLDEDGAATIPDRAAFETLSYQGEEVMIDTHLAGNEFVKFQIEGADGRGQSSILSIQTHRRT